MIGKINAAETSYDIFKILKQYGSSFQLDRFIVFLARQDMATDLDDRVILTIWDSEVIQRALGHDFFDWSFTRGLRASILPTCAILTEDPSEDEAGKDNSKLAGFLLSRGYRAFVHLPTRSSDGKFGAVSFNGDRGMVTMDEMMQLNFVAEHAFERLTQIIALSGPAENPLGDREIECLKEAARGLSKAETAHRIGITTHTVNYHLSNAQKKLGARNKLHSVVIAIQRGWLGRR